jgi:hypothetical protein
MISRAVRSLPFSLLLCPLVLSAQVKESGQWQFPTNIRSFCLNLEQTYVSNYKAMVENNRQLSSQKTKEGVANVMALTETYKESMEDIEKKWERLGCVHILYPPK